MPYTISQTRGSYNSPLLKKIRPRISFNRSHLLDKLGYIYTKLYFLKKTSKKSFTTEISSKNGTFFLLSNTYAKISWHPLANSFLTVSAEIKQGETALRSLWYLIIGSPNILNVTTLLKQSKIA